MILFRIKTIQENIITIISFQERNQYPGYLTLKMKAN